MQDLSRFKRQMILPGVGEAGQNRFCRAHVLVVGAGGLGCPVLQYLAGAGIGEITMFDPDRVEESNLHRQPLYAMADLGRPKVVAAQAHLLARNPDMRLNAAAEALDPANARIAVENADLVIDAADSFAVSYTLSDICLTLQKPLISASVLGQSGYVGGFCAGAPSLRAVFPEPPANGASCATAGVFGPVVGMMGTLQAQMALQVLLGHQPSPLGRMVSVDMETQSFGGFSFVGAMEPTQRIPFVSVGDLTTGDRVIELRDRREAPKPAYDKADRLSISEALELKPVGGRIVLCCRTGLRAWRTAVEMQNRGHSNLGLLAAGDGR